MVVCVVPKTRLFLPLRFPSRYIQVQYIQAKNPVVLPFDSLRWPSLRYRTKLSNIFFFFKRNRTRKYPSIVYSALAAPSPPFPKSPCLHPIPPVLRGEREEKKEKKKGYVCVCVRFFTFCWLEGFFLQKYVTDIHSFCVKLSLLPPHPSECCRRSPPFLLPKPARLRTGKKMKRKEKRKKLKTKRKKREKEKKHLTTHR